MESNIQQGTIQEYLWLGNAEGEDLQKMCSGYLFIFDDAIQAAFECGNESIGNEILQCYDSVESIKFASKRELLTSKQRDDLRSTAKYAMELIVLNELFDFSVCKGYKHSCIKPGVLN